MESQTLGRRSRFVPVASDSPQIQGMLVMSFIYREALFFTFAATAAPVSPDQDRTKLVYNQIEWSNRTEVYSTPVKCLVPESNKLPNETMGNYQLSIGHGIYVFAFIGILIVLKSLLTKITMVENKPEESEHVMSLCETPTTYKITLQKCTKNNNVSLTPPHSPSISQTLSPPITSTPVFFGGLVVIHCLLLLLIVEVFTMEKDAHSPVLRAARPWYKQRQVKEAEPAMMSIRGKHNLDFLTHLWVTNFVEHHHRITMKNRTVTCLVG